MKDKELTREDRAELEKFKLYLAACSRWDKTYDTRPDWAPISDLDEMAYAKKRIKAHAAIYKQIYGDA